MTTLAALVESTLAILYGLDQIERPVEDTLAGTLATVAVALNPTTTAMWSRDDYAEFPSSNEVIRLAEDGDASTVIRRAQLGTVDPGTTYPVGAVIVKNPPFYRHQLENYVRQVVRNDLWVKVWSWHQDTITPSEGVYSYELDQYIDSVALVYQYDLNSDTRWRALPRGWWDVERQIHSDAATNGGLLIVHRVYDVEDTVYLTAKRRPHIDDLANMTDELADLIPWAAAGKALAARSGQLKNAGARSHKDPDGQLDSDYRLLMGEFVRMRSQYASTLRLEVREDKAWRGATRAHWRSW